MLLCSFINRNGKQSECCTALAQDTGGIVYARRTNASGVHVDSANITPPANNPHSFQSAAAATATAAACPHRIARADTSRCSAAKETRPDPSANARTPRAAKPDRRRRRPPPHICIVCNYLRAASEEMRSGWRRIKGPPVSVKTMRA